MDYQPVHQDASGLWPQEALVLGRVHRRLGYLAPFLAPRSLVLAADSVVEAAGRHVQGRTAVAQREVPEMGRDLRPDLGPDHRQHKHWQYAGHTSGNRAVALQHVPSTPVHAYRSA